MPSVDLIQKMIDDSLERERAKSDAPPSTTAAFRSPFALLMIAGAKHSAQNARNLKAWLDERQFSKDNRRAFAMDYQKRGFLTREHAEEVAQGT